MRSIRPIIVLAFPLLHVRHQSLDSTHLETPFLTKRQAPLRPHHPRRSPQPLPRNLLSILDQLRAHTHQLLARQPTELNRRLSMPRALPHQSRPRLQREDMSRPPEIVPLDVLRAEHAARQRAILGADTGGCVGVVRIDGESVGCSLEVLALEDHLGEFEVDAEFPREWGADEAGGVSDHECHLLGRDVLGGDDEVALILTSGVVEDDYEFAVF